MQLEVVVSAVVVVPAHSSTLGQGAAAHQLHWGIAWAEYCLEFPQGFWESSSAGLDMSRCSSDTIGLQRVV